MDEILIQCWPTVYKNWLYFVAGLLWSAVGVMLLSRAAGWLKPLGLAGALPYAAAGMFVALVFYFLVFSKLAGKNVKRIEQMSRKKVGIFAFQAWKSYLIVIFMIVLGISLRHYTALSKPLLAIIYIGVGGGLFLSSLRYYEYLWNGRTIADGS